MTNPSRTVEDRLSHLEARSRRHDEDIEVLIDLAISTRSEVKGLRTDVTHLQTDVTGLRTDVTQLQTDVTGLRTDVTQLQTDVTGLRTDVTQLQTDVTGLRTESGWLTAAVRSLLVAQGIEPPPDHRV